MAHCCRGLVQENQLCLLLLLLLLLMLWAGLLGLGHRGLE